MLLAHGGRDARVPRRQSDQLAEALRARGRFLSCLVWEEEGHGFSREEDLLEFFRAVEHFAALHLGSRVEPGPAPLRLVP